MNQPPEPTDRRTVLQRALLAMEQMQSRLNALQHERREPIAIIGMGCRFPGHANNPEAYWNLLDGGVDAISEIPSERWDVDAYYDPNPDAPGKMYTRRGGFLDCVDRFDPYFFGMSPREAVRTDPQQRLALEVSWEALEDAAIVPGNLKGSQTGVFLGITNHDYARIVERGGLESIDAYHLTGNCLNFAAGRIAYSFGLQGPTMAVDTACSSSGVTIHLACQSLRNRECNMALAGGVNLILSPEISITSTKARTLSPDGYCRTFDSAANGYVRGEGCGILVLKRLSDAMADGDTIHAVIRGSAVNQDGASSGITVPNKLAQAEVMRQALDRAGIKPNQVDYVEAHGTGTPLGDPIEVRALASVYSQERSPDRPLIIGTAKTSVGHLESAAGVAGVIKVVLSLRHGMIPRHLHFTKLNPAIALKDIPAVIPVQPIPWPRGQKPRVAGLSFFGGSGTIAHMIVEEAPQVHAGLESNSRKSQLFCLSAKTSAALDELAGRYERYLANPAGISLSEVCYGAAAGRSHFNHRLAVVSATPEELRERLVDRRAVEEAPGVQTPRVAFLFTGQGGQYVNMGRRLYEDEPLFRSVIDRCDEYLRLHLPRSLRSVLYPGTGETTPLDETQYTHVAMFAVQYGLAALWRSWGVEPSIVMGHSVGEIVAATVAGQMSFEDGLQLMCERGRLMQSLPATGLMASVLADEQRVAAALAPYRDRVAIAAVNGPESTVISGEKTAVQAVLKQLEGAGVKVKVLKVSNAFHSPMVEPVLEEFERVARQMRYVAPLCPLFSSMRLEAVGENNLLDANYWRQNLRNTVRFSGAMRKLYEQGYRVFLEIGPSPILVRMGSQCVPVGEGAWLPSLQADRDDWQQLLESLGQLYTKGVDVDWDGFYRDRPVRKISLPTYPFQRERCWVDSVSGPTVQGSETGHPLLGRRLRSAVCVFEQQLTASGSSFLKDHCVFDQPVFPATAYLELALAAGARSFAGKQIAIKDLVFAQPLQIPGGETRTIQVTVTEIEPESAAFRLFSLDPKPEQTNPAWLLHASGTICAAAEGLRRLEGMDAIRGRCAQEIEVGTYYDSLRSRGLEFGPAFRGIEAIWAGDSESLGRIEAPASLSAGLDRYFVHPAFLDACLQPVVAAMPASVEPYLPQRLESFRVYRRPGDRVWSHVALRPNRGIAGGEMTADVDVLDPDGQTLVEVRGLVFRRAVREAGIATGQEDSGNDWLYEVKWEESPHQSARAGKSTATIPDPARVAEALLPYSRVIDADRGLREFGTLLPRIEAVSTQYVLAALRELGWTIAESETFTTDSKARELRVPQRYRRLLQRMLEMLREDGYLSKAGDEWKVRQAPPDVNPEEEITALLREHPACSAELTLIRRCGGHFARAIRGEAEPLELLFPGGSFTDAERLYKDSPYYRFYNQLMRQTVLELAGGVPPGRPLRILEIGAGTGSTTAYLLPELRHRETEYTFTDVSKLFLSKARETFASYPFVNYQVLDIEKSPVAQGIGEHKFDLVLASNVLHATADLRQTLQQVKTLLSSEGLLVLLEGTRPLRFADVIVGLTEGWWRFTDTHLRPDYALISAEQWRSLLTGSGFTEVAVSPEEGGESVLSNQSLILARGPRISLVSGSVTARRARWLVLADATGVGTGLQTALENAGAECVLVSAGTTFNRRDQGHFEIDAGCREHFLRVLRESGCSNESVLEGVVYLWPLDVPASSTGWETLKEGIRKGCGGLLHLVQALVSGGNLLANHLWIVTRGVQPVDSNSGFASLSQAPSAALRSTIALEYPEFHCAHIDLDPVASGDEADALLDEFDEGKLESLVAFRQGRRLAGRLVHSPGESSEPRKTPHADLSQPYELRVSSSRVLDKLSLCRVERRAPGPGEVEIQVHATGLGFRDVLMALGHYPEHSQVLGYECAGRIVRVGAGLTGLHAGQRVMAVGPGSYSAFLTIAAERIAPIPESLSDQQAATLPSAFLTAQYALCRLGRVSAGEKVMIHAAAGGVGLAAVQLAQRAGAEIFATAGSPEKRAYLASLDVPHVMDSRSLAFAGEIMEITGGRGVDVVLNSLAGDFIPKSLSVTAPKGRFLEIGKTGIWDHARVAGLNRELAYYPIDLAAVFDAEPGLVRSLFEELIPDFAQGVLKPLPFRSFPIDRAVSAFRFMAQARHVGKVIVSHPGSQAIGPDRTSGLDAGGSYLVTGGMRGLGLLVAQWLSERGARHLVLTGRSEVSDSAAAVIREIEAKGTEVTVSRGDVSDPVHLAALFSQFGRSLPALRGIIHCAGIVDDGVFAQQTWERFEKVMEPKVAGAWHLHVLSQAQPLDFFVLFSSAVSMLGSAGQANHVAACAFEDALAHYRHDLGLPALSINWGPWSDIGAATQTGIGDRLRMKGFRMIEPRQGLRVLEQLLGSQLVQAGVLSVDWRQYADAQPSGSQSSFLTGVLSRLEVPPHGEQRKAAQKLTLLEQLSQTLPGKRRALLEAHIREHAIRVLGFNPSSKLDPNQGLASLGMDSLMTIELKNRLQNSLGKPLSSTIVFDHPTVADLAAYLERSFLMGAEGSTRPQPDDRAGNVSDLQQMTEEDAEAMLAKELSS